MATPATTTPTNPGPVVQQQQQQPATPNPNPPAAQPQPPQTSLPPTPLQQQQTRGQSTKEKLLCIVDDVEMIVKDLLESNILAQKSEKPPHPSQSNLIQLLMEKNNEFKGTLKLAQDQQEISTSMHALSTEVSRHDQDIQMLQKHLKEADTILSTALFQARQKLDQIQKAQGHQVSSEDLIRFAHRISSTNAVAAPVSWAPGDPRRPYPTDIEMRMGLLARINDMPISQVLDSLHPPPPPPLPLLTPTHQTNSTRDQFPPPPIQHHNNNNAFNQQPWYSTASSDLQSSIPSSIFSSNIPDHVRGGGGGNNSNNNNNNNNHDDVEVMSTDSSSSSSSDSQ